MLVAFEGKQDLIVEIVIKTAPITSPWRHSWSHRVIRLPRQYVEAERFSWNRGTLSESGFRQLVLHKARLDSDNDYNLYLEQLWPFEGDLGILAQPREIGDGCQLWVLPDDTGQRMAASALRRFEAEQRPRVEAERVATEQRKREEIQLATVESQEESKKFKIPFQSVATEIKNQILERNVNDQLSKSSEGVARVRSSVAFILRRFEPLINEIQRLSIQIKHPEPFASHFSTIMALGPGNANIEITNKSENRTVEDELAILLFIWEDDFRILGGKKRRERKRIVYSPSFTANREVWTLKAGPPRARMIEGVLWPNEGDPSKALVTSEAVAHQAVSCLLQFVRECVQKSDAPGPYLPPEVL